MTCSVLNVPLGSSNTSFSKSRRKDEKEIETPGPHRSLSQDPGPGGRSPAPLWGGLLQAGRAAPAPPPQRGGTECWTQSP